MDKTITELQTKLEELKKRLKSISTAQSNQTALVAIKSYFSTIQEYLNIINSNYSSHIEECSSHTTSISDLQNQIDEINLKIENLPTGESDTTELQNSIANLENSLQELQANFNELIENSDTTISQIVNDISDLQTEVGIINDYISTHEQDFADLNNKINTIETNIDNLTTAQSGMESTQSNLATNLNSVENRLSTAEANINALTGGVDVSGLDNRITNIEEQNRHKCIITNKYPIFLNLTPTTPLYSLYYYYKLDTDTCVLQDFNISYTSLGVGELTISLLQNNLIVKTEVINLSTYPTSYRLKYLHIPTDSYQNFQFLFSSTENISINFLQATFIGKNLELFETDKDLTVECFDNKIFISRYYNNRFYIGTYSSSDEISIEPQNLKDVTSFLPTDIRCATFGPELKTINSKADMLNLQVSAELGSNKLYTRAIDYAGTYDAFMGAGTSSEFKYSTVKLLSAHQETTHNFIYNNLPAHIEDEILNTQTLTNLENHKTGRWYFSTVILKLDCIKGVSNARSITAKKTLAYNEDGYLYFINGLNVSSASKIAPGGKFATGYLASSGYNVYINYMNHTDKYNLKYNSETKKYDSTFIETIPNCDCVYELSNGRRILHMSSGWIIE